MVSSVGVISLTRRYWQCRCGEAGAYAVDPTLGIESRYSTMVQKHACRLAADTSFLNTSEHLNEMLRVKLCAETLRTMVEGHGKAMAEFQLAEHVLGDGASWIWKSATRALSGCVQTLDVYHASERLAKAAKAIYGEGTAEATTAFERGRSLLLSKGWAGVCEWVGEFLLGVEGQERERRREATDGVIGYFSKHVGRLNYAERLASGRAIGSGAVEGQAKTLGLRLKSRGARWNRANVRPMASLVCVRHSPQWDAYWSQAA